MKVEGGGQWVNEGWARREGGGGSVGRRAFCFQRKICPTQKASGAAQKTFGKLTGAAKKLSAIACRIRRPAPPRRRSPFGQFSAPPASTPSAVRTVMRAVPSTPCLSATLAPAACLLRSTYHPDRPAQFLFSNTPLPITVLRAKPPGASYVSRPAFLCYDTSSCVFKFLPCFLFIVTHRCPSYDTPLVYP